MVRVTNELLEGRSTLAVSSAEMIVQGYHDAGRKRRKARRSVPVPRVSDVLFDSIDVGRRAADALGQQIITGIMEMSR